MDCVKNFRKWFRSSVGRSHSLTAHATSKGHDRAISISSSRRVFASPAVLGFGWDDVVVSLECTDGWTPPRKIYSDYGAEIATKEHQRTRKEQRGWQIPFDCRSHDLCFVASGRVHFFCVLSCSFAARSADPVERFTGESFTWPTVMMPLFDAR